MRVSVLSTGPRPCRILSVQTRIVASRAYGSAPEEAPGLLPASSVAPPPPNVGEKIKDWLVSPFDIAAFGPRLTVGALLSAPEKIQSLQSEISKAQETLSSPAPAEDKGKLLAAQIETYVFILMLPCWIIGVYSLQRPVSLFEIEVWSETNRHLLESPTHTRTLFLYGI